MTITPGLFFFSFWDWVPTTLETTVQLLISLDTKLCGDGLLVVFSRASGWILLR